MKIKFYLFLFSIIAFNCQPDTPPPNPTSVPTVTTTAITAVTSSSASGGGNVTADGGASVTARGVCWSTTTNPTVSGSHTTDGTGTGAFTSAISGLTPSTLYYIRAYATNSAGTAYGAELTFTTTPGAPGLPSIITAPITAITNTTATSGGNVTGDGGSAVLSKGICWSTTANPNLTNNFTIDGSGTGTFISSMGALTANTTYFVRAYATNNVGTAYGNELSFTTSPTAPVLPTLTTTAVTAITNNAAASGGNITSDGGAAVTARGVCWSTTTNPLATGNHTTDGTGTGTFTSAITGLTANTTYFVRAYATNSAGTAYGNELLFTTLPAAPVIPTLTTTAISSITSNSASSGGNITSSGGAPVTARGVCWSTSMNPTISGSHTTDGTGIGIFTSAITGLAGGTTYFVRAYATNSAGTAYGNQLSFTTSTSPAVDIYVSGFENNGTYDKAKYWKNGVITNLPNWTTHGAMANSIFVSGNDVYVAGTDSNAMATVWKNGTQTILMGPQSEAFSVFVAGTDVYVAGYEQITLSRQATVWKNGIPTHLTNGASLATSYSVFVSGTDVYAAGFEGNVAKVWKNSVPTSLTSGASQAQANSVFVSGTDVYVAGYEKSGPNNIAMLWKNGVPTVLGTTNGNASSVFVLGADVYVAGYESSGGTFVAKYWKNGVPTLLTGGTTHAFAASIFVVGSDVYVGGTESNGTKFVAKYWKNGLSTPLTNGTLNATGTGIYIK